MSDQFGDLKNSGDKQEFETGAKRDVQTAKSRPDLLSPFALERLGWVFSKGADHYGDRNWEKGMPLSRYLASAERHLMQFKQGDTDEDHLAQTVWNLCAILHHQEVGPHGLDDLPKYERLPKKQEPAVGGAYAEVEYAAEDGQRTETFVTDQGSSVEMRGH